MILSIYLMMTIIIYYLGETVEHYLLVSLGFLNSLIPGSSLGQTKSTSRDSMLYKTFCKTIRNTGEAEARRLQDQGQPGQFRETLSQNLKTHLKRWWSYSIVAKYLPGMCKALSSVPSSTNEQQNRPKQNKQTKNQKEGSCLKMPSGRRKSLAPFGFECFGRRDSTRLSRFREVKSTKRELV